MLVKLNQNACLRFVIERSRVRLSQVASINSTVYDAFPKAFFLCRGQMGD